MLKTHRPNDALANEWANIKTLYQMAVVKKGF